MFLSSAGKLKLNYDPANTYFFKVNSKNTRKRSELCSKLIKKHQNEVIKFEPYFTSFSSNSIADFNQVDVSWGITEIIFDKV